MPLKQQPLAQVFPAQHASPGLPQLRQVPAAVELVAEHSPPALQRLGLLVVAVQQGSPKPPHVEQVPLLQRRPALQVAAVPQQGWLTPPQPVQTLALHAPPEAPPVPVALPQVVFSATHWLLKQQPLLAHRLPAQQGVPGWPQVTQVDVDDVPLQMSPSTRQVRPVPVLPPLPPVPLVGAVLQQG